MSGERGLLLQRVIALDFALRKGIQVDISDIPGDEFAGLQILEQEQNRHEKERLEESQRKYGKHS